jgi:hypothetical protein
MSTFSALVLSLPTRDSTVRMRVWRALKGTGCGTLRDGVYLLPKDGRAAEGFRDIEEQVRAARGFAMTVDLDFGTRQAFEHARGLFDRSGEYGGLVERVRQAESSLAKLGKRKAETELRRVQDAFHELAAIDFFPGEARRQAQAAIEALQAEVLRLDSPGEPRSRAGKVRRADPAEFRGRTWATRKDLWADRMASAWLIKRFIDREARFTWIDAPRDCPRRAVGFDFDGARFTHLGGRVTFEVLLATFGLESDKALATIGSLIHFLDAGGIPAPDARGLETVLRGITQKTADDDERASKAFAVFDYFYAAYTST